MPNGAPASPVASQLPMATRAERAVSAPVAAHCPSVSRSVSTTSSARPGPAASTTSQPWSRSSQAVVARRRTSAGPQLVGHAQAQITHLLAAHRKALLLGQLRGAVGGNLADDGGRQQLLLHAQRDELVPADGVEAAARGAQRHPAARLQVEGAAVAQRARVEARFEFAGGQVEVGRRR
jgi:hypothetical protein